MTSQSPSFPFQVLLVFSRISLFSFKSTHLFYYATHTQQKTGFQVERRQTLITNKWKQYGVLFAYHKIVGPPSAGLSLLQHPGTAPKPHLTPLVRSLPLSYKTRLAQERAG